MEILYRGGTQSVHLDVAIYVNSQHLWIQELDASTPHFLTRRNYTLLFYNDERTAGGHHSCSL
jgi:hypothetical protein